MRKCRPSKWVSWSLVGAGLPLLAAALLSTPSLKSDVVNRAKASLSGSDLTKWAAVDMDGRVANISGKTTNPNALEEVTKLVAGTYGVRQVVSTAVVEPLALVAPTIESLTATAPVSEIKGTWPEDVAKQLTVKVGEATYTLPGSPELTTSGGNWVLKLPQPLPEGTHAVTANASLDSDGATISQDAQAPAQIVVDVPDATTFAVAPLAAGATWPYAITGTYPDADTAKFTATVDGREYVLGRGAALVSEAPGTFKFQPSRTFAPGSYDVDFSVTDKAGTVTTVKADKAIVVAGTVAATDSTPPAAPGFAATATDATDARSISGTWPEGDATSLSANFQGRTYVLGRGSALTRTEDKPGTFTFAPNTASLAAGKYPVEFAAMDAAGNVAKTQAENAIVIPEPPKATEATPEPAATPAEVMLAAPTVEKQLDLTGAPIIRGTWPKGEGTSLTVGLAGKTYELGSSANLAEDGPGKWRLLPSAALKDGIYDVVVTAKKESLEVKDASLAEIEVDATLPTAPTIDAYASDTAPTALTGSYDVKQTTKLKVALPELNIAAELGATGSALTADADGKWSLALSQPIAPGTYNAVVTATDDRGRSVEDTAASEIVISAHNEPAPKSNAQFDCNAVMTRISTVFPMRFIYNKIDFQERFGLSVSQYAALLKDSRCSSLKVEVGGHADERGTDEYNEALAERRANHVRDMLVEAGVTTERLSVASYGESMPLDTSGTEEAWGKNRRVEIKIVK